LKLYKNKGKVVDYNGDRSAKAIVSFATSHIKSSVEKVTSEEALEKFLAKSPSLPHLLLFSDKGASNLYQALSMQYNGKLVLGLVKNDVSAVVSKYNVESFPHLITFTGETVNHFTGDLGKEGLVRHAKAVATGVVPQEEPASNNAEQPKAAPKKPKDAPKPLAEVNAGNVVETCSTGKLCFLAFLDATDDSQKATLASLHDSYSKDGKIIFAWTSCGGEKSLCDKFGVSAPAAVVLNRSKKGKAAVVSSFSVEEASAVLDRALGGDLTYSPTKAEL